MNMENRFRSYPLCFVLAAALGLIGWQAQGAVPTPAAATQEQASPVQCQPGQAGCQAQPLTVEQWCQKNPDGCAALKERTRNPVQCSAGPAACDRARLESQLNDRVDVACTQKNANSERCKKLRALLDKLKAKDRKSAGSQGG